MPHLSLRTETGFVRCWWKVAFTICIFWQLPVTCLTELCSCSDTRPDGQETRRCKM